MKKPLLKMIGIVLTLTIVFSMSAVAFAAQPTDATVVPVESLFDTPEFLEWAREIKEQSTEDANEKALLRGPAPPVTEVYIYYVRSGGDQSGYINLDMDEPININQISTVLNHYGYKYVYTFKMGYGDDTATMNGGKATLWDDELIDVDGDNIIDGFACIWELAPGLGDSGTFWYSSLSWNYPWNTMSTFLNIL